MKKTALPAAICLLLIGCASDLRLSAYDPALESLSIRQAAVIQLKGARYPMHHNIAAVKNVDFPSLCLAALEKSLQKKRKAWKIVPPSTVTAADPDLGDFIPLDPQSIRNLDTAARERMTQTASVLENRLFFVIEHVSVKDVSSPQAPAMMVVGACLDLWDFEKGAPLYRARNVSRPIGYAEGDFSKKAEPALYDLFCGLITPLPK